MFLRRSRSRDKTLIDISGNNIIIFNQVGGKCSNSCNEWALLSSIRKVKVRSSRSSFVKFSTDDARTKYFAKASFRNSSRGTIPASLQ